MLVGSSLVVFDTSHISESDAHSWLFLDGGVLRKPAPGQRKLGIDIIMVFSHVCVSLPMLCRMYIL